MLPRPGSREHDEITEMAPKAMTTAAAELHVISGTLPTDIYHSTVAGSSPCRDTGKVAKAPRSCPVKWECRKQCCLTVHREPRFRLRWPLRMQRSSLSRRSDITAVSSDTVLAISASIRIVTPSLTTDPITLASSRKDVSHCRQGFLHRCLPSTVSLAQSLLGDPVWMDWRASLKANSMPQRQMQSSLPYAVPLVLSQNEQAGTHGCLTGLAGARSHRGIGQGGVWHVSLLLSGKRTGIPLRCFWPRCPSRNLQDRSGKVSVRRRRSVWSHRRQGSR